MNDIRIIRAATPIPTRFVVVNNTFYPRVLSTWVVIGTNNLGTEIDRRVYLQSGNTIMILSIEAVYTAHPVQERR